MKKLNNLRARLTPEQFFCTQECGTEPPFNNLYWNNHEDGIYVDVVSGEPLFLSIDKFDSGTGWPSFTQPVSPNAVTFQVDSTKGMERIEVRSKYADSHLGHVFDDGPPPSFRRYCINSAALRFIPLDLMNKEGYGRYLFEFAEKKGWEIATLAGGCFWGMEELLRKIPGVIETQVGYTGGHTQDACYEDVKTGTTGHAEAVQILFDPKIIQYKDILLYFFKIHDPTTPNQQGNDRGSQYRSVIFYANLQQKEIAEAILFRVQNSGKWGSDRTIVTQIVPAKEFWSAEEEHQKYLQKDPNGYTCHYQREIDF